MIGIERLKITPDLLEQMHGLAHFRGYWEAAQRHTTALNLLPDFHDYGSGFKEVLEPLQEMELKPEVILTIHRMMVKDSNALFKDSENELLILERGDLVGILDTAAPEEAVPLLRKLCDWYEDAVFLKKLDPLVALGVFVAIFLQICPFEKENLRTVRFLIVLELLKAGYDYAPFAALDQVTDAHGGALYRGLKALQEGIAHNMPDWEEWLSCFFGILLAHKDVLYERLKAPGGEDLPQLDPVSKRVLELLQMHKRMSMKELIFWTEAPRSSLKVYLKGLIEDGYIKRHGAGRSVYYALS